MRELKTAPWLLASVEGKFNVYRSPRVSESRWLILQSSCTKNSAMCARGFKFCGWISILKESTWPSRNEARLLPVFGSGVPFAVRPLVKIWLKENKPVGSGGCRTSSRSMRISAPNFKLCAPLMAE